MGLIALPNQTSCTHSKQAETQLVHNTLRTQQGKSNPEGMASHVTCSMLIKRASEQPVSDSILLLNFKYLFFNYLFCLLLCVCVWGGGFLSCRLWVEDGVWLWRPSDWHTRVLHCRLFHSHRHQPSSAAALILPPGVDQSLSKTVPPSLHLWLSHRQRSRVLITTLKGQCEWGYC